MIKFVLPLAVLVGIVLLMVFSDGPSSVTTQPISHVSSESTTRIFAPGRIEGARLEVELRPELSGRLAEVSVSEGQRVQQGQVLLRLDSDQYKHELALADANVRLAQAEKARLENGSRVEERREADSLYRAKLAALDQAELAWQRAQRLRADNVATQQEVDDRESRVKSLTAETHAARSRLELLNAPPRPDELQIAESRIAAAIAHRELAAVQMKRTVLEAPFAGEVLAVNVAAGELAGPELVQPAIVMADISRFRVRAFVEEMDAPRVRVGMTAEVVADGLPGQTFSGQVSQLSPRMSRKQLWTNAPAERYDTKTREVWVDLNERADFVVGLRVDVTILPDADNGAGET